MLSITKSRFIHLLFWVVIANFLAQIPYYFHQYYSARKLLPSLVGMILMGMVLAWFIAGYSGLKRGRVYGYRVTISFLAVEFLFYLQTQIVQLMSGNGVLLHVLHPDDGVLFIVFLVGYINFIAAAGFLYYLVKYRSVFFTKRSEL